MAVRYAVATGNWSAVETWDGGASLPGVGDDVYANGFDVSIDQDIEVNKISTEVCPITSVGGGRFYTIKSGDFYLIGNIVAGLSGCLDYGTGLSTSSRLYLIGNVYGGTLSNAYGIYLSSIAYSNSPVQQPIIIGNLYGGSGALSSAIVSRADREFTLVLTGNIYAGTGAIGVNIASGSTYVSRITGNVYANGAFRGFSSSCILYFTGVAYPSTTTWAIQATTLYVSGTIVNNNGIMGFLYTTGCKVYIQTGGSLSWQFDVENGSTMTLYSNNVVGFPSENDVRKDVQYGAIQEYTGKMVVPIEGHVIQGVEYDINKIGQLPVAQTINSQDVTDIMSNIANIEIKIDNVDDKIDTIDTSINTVNNNISNMNIDINTIENELDTAITNINTIDGKVDVIDGKIDTLPTDTLNELKQDDLGERLSKVGTIEEMTNIIINS